LGTFRLYSKYDDVSHLKTSAEVYYGLRLDYDDITFKPTVGYAMIEFYVPNASSVVKVPTNNEMLGLINNAHPYNGDIPFTGNGFTGNTSGRLIPEYYIERGTPIFSGARMYTVSPNGTKTLIAEYIIPENATDGSWEVR